MTAPSDTERPHHPYSPSWLQSGEACPHFQSKESAHVRAIMGTIAHRVTETGEDDARLSDEDAAAAAQCMDFYDSRKRLMAANLPSDLPVGTIAFTELKESYLEIDECAFEDAVGTTAGYVDRSLISWDFTYAELFDWKFGLWHVEEAGNNLQGFSYALGLFRRYKTLKAIRFYFKQPLLGYITHVDILRENIVPIYLRIQVIVARAREARKRNDFSMAVAHAGACNFCKHLGVCPVVQKFALEVGHKFHPLAVPANVQPTLASDPAQTSLALSLAGVLKVWCDAIKRQISDRVLRQVAPMPDGYMLVESRKRAMADFSKFREVALKYLSPQDWESCLEAGFGEVEKKISEKAPRGQKETTVKEFQAKCAEAGATVLGNPFSFLKPVSQTKNKNTNEISE